jgi:hypothetical protein
MRSDTRVFVQVEEGLLTSRLVDRARAIGLDTDQAIGKLVRLWLATLKLQTGGVIGDRSDAWMEEVVGWRGEPGVFAGFVREHHLDASGRIRDWMDTYGKLELIRKVNRERKGKQRQQLTEEPNGLSRGQTVRQGVGQTVGPAVRQGCDNGGDRRCDTSPSSSLSLAVEQQGQENGDQGRARDDSDPIRALFAVDEFGEATEAVEALVRSARRPHAVVGELRALVGGMRGRAVPLNVLRVAAEQYNASDEVTVFSPRYFMAFCDNASRQLARGEGQRINDREGSYVERESKAAKAREAEAADSKTLLADFKRDNPERFAELEIEARAFVEASGMTAKSVGFNVLVTGKLQSLVRQEVSGVQHA